MNGKVLLLIIGLVLIAGVAYANTDFISILKVISVGATNDVAAHCTALIASVPSGTGATQTITITVPFTTSGAINGVSLGTITVPITTSSSQNILPTTSVAVAITGTGTSLTPGSDIISGTVPGTSFTLTDSGITVTTTGATTGTITITETVTLNIAGSITLGPPSITGTGAGLSGTNSINCPTLDVNFF